MTLEGFPLSVKINPLAMAVDAHDCMHDMIGEMMEIIGGNGVFDPYDSELSNAIGDLIFKASDGVFELSDRARVARLNLIWKSFVEEQKQKRSKPSEQPQPEA